MPRLSAARVAFGIILVAGGLPVAAQTPPLRLSIQDGRVTLHAENVPVRTILAEWARIGGTKVVNAERLTGGPVSLDLNGFSEREVLDILLRGVSGYVLGARTSPAAGASAFDRILILPGSAAPPAAAAPAAAAVNPRARAIPAPQFPSQPENDPTGNSTDNIAPGGQPQGMPAGPRFGPAPSNPGVPPVFGQPQDDPEPSQTPGGSAVAPGNPFGMPAGSSSRPGVLTPVPEPKGASPRQVQDPN